MESRQKVFIKIIQLNADLLQIEPVAAKGNSYSYSGSSDLSIEFSDLEKQLKEYGLVIKEDFVANQGEYSREYKFDFKGKSLVVRALNAIPVDLIQFGPSPYEYGSHYKFSNKTDFEKSKLTLALKLNSKDCYHSEIICVQQAQTTMFNNLVNDIAAIHNLHAKSNSTVLIQLRDEIEILAKKQDTLFENTNFMLLMSALHNASCVEKEKRTVCESGFSMFKKESIVSPEYEKLMVKYASHVPLLFKSTQYSNKVDPIIKNLNASYQLINPKTSNIISMTNTNSKKY